MANVFAKVGQFTLNTSTGNQTISGLGFTPKLVLMFGNDMTSDTLGANAVAAFGYATTLNAFSTSMFAADNSASADTRNGYWPAPLSIVSATTTKCRVSLVSFASGQFTINVDVTDGVARKVQYIALGGTDLSTHIGNNTSPLSTGNQAYTGFGFQPTMIIGNQAMATGSGGGTLNRGQFNLGFASSAFQGYISNESDDGTAATDSRRKMYNDAVLHVIDTAGAVEIKGSRQSLDAGGWTANFSTVSASARQLGYLGLAGGSWYAGSFNQPLSTGTQSITGLGFTPKLVFLMSRNNADDDVSYTNMLGTIGASDGTNQYSIWWTDDDGADPTYAKQSLDSTRIFHSREWNNGNLRALATLTSLYSGGFDLNWSQVSGLSDNAVYFIAFGDVAASEVIKSHTFDVATEKTTIKSHTFSTVTRVGKQKTHTFDTYLKRGGTKTHTLDTYLSKAWTQTTYRFDGSGGISDPDSAWSNDANAFDTDEFTGASASAIGSTSDDYLHGQGTDAPASNASTIYQVRWRMRSAGDFDGGRVTAKVYTDGLAEELGSANGSGGLATWQNWAALTVPTGGWTWAKIAALEIKAYVTGIPSGTMNFYKAEIEVTHLAVSTTTINHTFDVYTKNTKIVQHTFSTALKQGKSVSHTLDTALEKASVKSHTFDVVTEKPRIVQHTFDTILKKPRITSHTLDTATRKPNLKQHTFDVVTEKPRTLEHTFDTSLRKPKIVSHTFDTALKVFGRTVQHTFDVMAKKAAVLSHTLDTYLRRSIELEHTFDVVTEKAATLQHTFDTILKKPRIVQHTFDVATKVFGRIVDHTFDIATEKPRTLDHTFDVVTQIGAVVSHTFDVATRTAHIISHTFDTILQTARDAQHTFDVFTKKGGVRTHTFDTILKRAQVSTHTFDVVTQKTGDIQHSFDVLTRRGGTLQHTFDTVLRRPAVKEHTFDVVTEKTRVISHTFDTLISSAGVVTHQFDTIVKKEKAVQHTFDVLTIKHVTLQHSFDVLLRAPRTLVHTFDTALKEIHALDHSFDVYTKRTPVTQHTFDTLTRATTLTSHTFDVYTAVEIQTRIKTHTFDTFLKKRYTGALFPARTLYVSDSLQPLIFRASDALATRIMRASDSLDPVTLRASDSLPARTMNVSDSMAPVTVVC